MAKLGEVKENWEENNGNRNIWRLMVREGIAVGEERWRSREEEKHVRRRNRRAHHEQ